MTTITRRVEAQINVLERNLVAGVIHDRYDADEDSEKTYELDCALDARRWLDGESDQAELVHDWLSLVKK